eukprot:scaffold8782_cov121-Skeletonema_marinoi.AAC.1
MVDKAAGCIDIYGDGVLYRRGYPSTLLLWPAPLKLKASIAVESNPSLNSMGCLNRCSYGIVWSNESSFQKKKTRSR